MNEEDVFVSDVPDVRFFAFGLITLSVVVAFIAVFNLTLNQFAAAIFSLAYYTVGIIMYVGSEVL